MAKPELGTKRVCQSCGAKFYDLSKDPITCPKCGAVYEIVVPVTIRPPRTVSMRDHSHERIILEMLEDNEIRKRRRTDQAAAAAE